MDKELVGKFLLTEREMEELWHEVGLKRAGGLMYMETARAQLLKAIPIIAEEIKGELEKLRKEPRLYHHICFASGVTCIVDHYGDKEIFKCRYFNGDFNCGYRGCKSGEIKGHMNLTEIETHQNWMLDSILRQEFWKQYGGE